MDITFLSRHNIAAIVFLIFGFLIPVAGQSADPDSTDLLAKSTTDQADQITIKKPVKGEELTRVRSSNSLFEVHQEVVDHSLPNPQSGTSGWEFEVAPYVFATGIRGTVAARGRALEADSSFFDVIKNVKGLAMFKFDVRKGKFVFTNDLMWIKLSADAKNPGRLYNTTDLGVNFFMLHPEAGYRVYETDRSSVDVLAGVRIWSVEANLRTTSGVLSGFDVSQRKSWAAPVVGVRGTTSLTPKFFLDGKFDIGGAGIGADLTTQVYAGGGYRLFKKFSIVGGFRWLQVDYDDSSGFIFDTRMTGLMFGAKFSF